MCGVGFTTPPQMLAPASRLNLFEQNLEKSFLLQYLFDLLYVLPALIYAPVFFLKSRRAGESPSLLFSERLGCISSKKLSRLQGKRILWVHAVSVGEVMVARRFIESLRSLASEAKLQSAASYRPFDHFVLTTVTPTGQKLARQSEASDLTAIYVPFDFSFCVRSFLNRIKPEALVLVETEIWPNLILNSMNKKLPIFLINARLSQKSLDGYRLVSALFARVFSGITRVFAQGAVDGERFHALGVDASKIEITGNIKFDTAIPEKTIEVVSRKKFGLSEANQVWIAGSTHPGEEKKLFDIFLKLREKHLNLKLILAPRHVERTDALLRELSAKNVLIQRWSTHQLPSPWDVLVVDQIGVLKDAYALGNFVFMGGSWIPHGGQNPIEPAVFNLPILHGPHVFNFKQVYEILDAAGAATCVLDSESCFEKVVSFLNHPDQAAQTGRLAGETVGKYRGASARQARRVMESLNERKSES